MDSQISSIIPIPIIGEIIWFCDKREKVSFRRTCKLFMNFVDRNIFTGTITTTLCGSSQGYEDGIGINSKLNHPYFGCLDSSSKFLYFTDEYNHVIRRIDLSTNEVSTICGAPTKSGFRVTAICLC